VSGYGMRKADVREASPKLQILAGIQIQAACSGIRYVERKICSIEDNPKVEASLKVPHVPTNLYIKVTTIQMAAQKKSCRRIVWQENLKKSGLLDCLLYSIYFL
jgi:hypothetical protein